MHCNVLKCPAMLCPAQQSAALHAMHCTISTNLFGSHLPLQWWWANDYRKFVHTLCVSRRWSGCFKSIDWRYPNTIFVLQWFFFIYFYHVFFMVFVAILLKFDSRTESVQKRNHWLAPKRVNKPLFVTNRWLLCCTDSVRQKRSKKMTEKGLKSRNGQNW